MKLVSILSYPYPAYPCVSGFDVEDVGVIKSVFFYVTGVSGFDICLTPFEDFGVLKLCSPVSLGSHLESLSLEVLK